MTTTHERATTRDVRTPPRLSQREKALLFDAAMNAAGDAPSPVAIAPTPDARTLPFLVVACAAAYIAIRDREDGIV